MYVRATKYIPNRVRSPKSVGSVPVNRFCDKFRSSEREIKTEKVSFKFTLGTTT